MEIIFTCFCNFSCKPIFIKIGDDVRNSTVLHTNILELLSIYTHHKKLTVGCNKTTFAVLYKSIITERSFI